MIVRPETPADFDAISDITQAAFVDHPFSQQTEHFIIRALRRAGALSLSLVAERDERVLGHIAFSSISISDGSPGWYGLGPVSVRPEQQRKGIGKALIFTGLAELRLRGAGGCALVGDPDYYRRLGFGNDPVLTHAGVPPEVFLVMPFTPQRPVGQVVFHEAFQAAD